jgi:hypothetical protein
MSWRALRRGAAGQRQLRRARARGDTARRAVCRRRRDAPRAQQQRKRAQRRSASALPAAGTAALSATQLG